jgi:hypothetical protein
MSGPSWHGTGLAAMNVACLTILLTYAWPPMRSSEFSATSPMATLTFQGDLDAKATRDLYTLHHPWAASWARRQPASPPLQTCRHVRRPR